MTRNHLSTFIGIIIALVAAYVAVKDVDMSELFTVLWSAHYGYVLPALLFTAAGYFARAWRWQVLLAPAKPVAFRVVLPVLVLGFAWNVAIPLRVGELVRVQLLGQRERISRSTVLATVVVERVLDGVAVMALLALVAWLQPALPTWALDFSRAALLIFGIAFVGLVILLISEPFAMRLLAITLRVMPHALAMRLDLLARAFMQGFHGLRSPFLLLQVLLSTSVVWLIEAASYAVLFPSFTLTFDMPTFISAASFYTVALNLATLVPTPGGGGTTELIGQQALSIFGIVPSLALSFTVIAHIIQLVVILTLGAWALWREGLNVKRLEQMTTESESGIIAQ